jgi:putative ABC transport system permease protein
VLRVAQSYGLPRVQSVGVDGRAVMFAVAVTALSLALFGLLPALRAARAAPREELQRSGRGGGAAGAAHRLSRALVAVEMAMSVVLVTAAGLVLASFQTVRSIDPGVDVTDVAVVRLLPHTQEYDGAAAVELYRSLEARIAALPGVAAVGAIQLEPFTGGNWAFPYLAEGHVPVAGAPLPSANFRVVTPGYFDAVDMPLVAGRRFGPEDRDGAAGALILNETFARELWPGENPIGREVRIFGDRPFRVVGVVGDVRQHALDRAPSAEMYVPHAQWDLASMAVMVEADDAVALGRSIRSAVTEIDTDIPVTGPRPMAELLGESLARRRFFAILLGGFGVLALLLGGVGIYGVTAHLVGSMLPDAGVHLALGATPGSVLRQVMRRSLMPAAAGLLLGLALAVGSGRLLQSLLFGIAPVHVPTFAAVTAVLSGVAVLATWLPARRAARLDPLEVLRAD